MRLTCAIIDDEPLAVSLLESYVLKTPFLDLQGTYNSALDALSDLRDRPVDLLFLDIQMPELSGLEFSRILNADTRVIFTTAFDQYAVDSYRVKGYAGYINKGDKQYAIALFVNNYSCDGRPMTVAIEKLLLQLFN